MELWRHFHLRGVIATCTRFTGLARIFGSSKYISFSANCKKIFQKKIPKVGGDFLLVLEQLTAIFMHIRGDGLSLVSNGKQKQNHLLRQSQLFQLLSGMLRQIVVTLLIGFLAWAYQANPPRPNVCGSPGGPAITAPRIKLRDGRHLAYEEHGVSKELAKYKIIFVHGFASCRNDVAIEDINELGVYILSFDRPGYGESDPHPKQTRKSLALDMEELADQLGLGSKFYVVGFSMGGQAVWSCLKYIPHRLAGAALIAPVINYWWPGLPANLSKKAYEQQLPQDQWALRIAHYTPWLTYWWNTQKLFPASAVVAGKPDIFSAQDVQLLPKLAARQSNKGQALQQGVFESIHRDMMIGFGTWDFDPIDLKNPFPKGEGSIHLWQGDDDMFVPVTLQRYISRALPWIHYHEIPGSGHLFPYADGVTEAIIRSLLLGEKVTAF